MLEAHALDCDFWTHSHTPMAPNMETIRTFGLKAYDQELLWGIWSPKDTRTLPRLQAVDSLGHAVL